MRFLFIIAIFCAPFVHSESAKEITIDEIKDYADANFDKGEFMHKTITLGTYNGTNVIAEHPCADLCPMYTIRIVRFETTNENCHKIKGALKKYSVPVGIGVMDKEYCVPNE